MKKFVFMHFGYEPPTPEIMEAWNKWFASLGDRIVDPGSPLGHGHEITHEGTRELNMDENALTGYTVIQAESMAEAEKLAQDCPIITSMRVYEAMSMSG